VRQSRRFLVIEYWNLLRVGGELLCRGFLLDD
jgi:hypothetical protein